MTGKSESEPIRIATKGLLIILTISVKDAQITETLPSAQSSILIENGSLSLVVKEKDSISPKIKSFRLTRLYLNQKYKEIFIMKIENKIK